MVALLLAAAGLMVVVFAARFTRFRRIAEPVLSVLVAGLLISAFIIWLNDDSNSQQDPAPPLDASRSGAVIRPDQIALLDVTFTPGQPAGSYLASGMVRNDSDAFLDYFDLDVTLEDCGVDPCRTVGRDQALVLARLAPGRSAPLRVSLVFPVRRGEVAQTPRFTAAASSIRAAPAGP